MAFKKGASGNPGGLTKEQRKARDELRAALAGDAKRVHRALLALVRKRNATAVIYAHTLLHGKEPDAVTVEHSGSVEVDYTRLSDEKLKQLESLLLEASVEAPAETH